MSAGNKDADIMPIPGLEYLYSKSPSSFPKSVLLVIGPTGSGKTLYCTEFIKNGLDLGDHCLYVNFGQTVSEEKFIRNSDTPGGASQSAPVLLNYSFSSQGQQESALQHLSDKIRSLLTSHERSRIA